MNDHPLRILQLSATTPRVTTIDHLLDKNHIQTCSVVLRRAAVPVMPEWKQAVQPGDWPLFILAADRGHVVRIDEVMADYRVHTLGVWTQTNDCIRTQSCLTMLAAVDRHFNGRYAKQIDALRDRTIRCLFDDLAAARIALATTQAALASAHSPWAARVARTIGQPFAGIANWFGRRLFGGPTE